MCAGTAETARKDDVGTSDDVDSARDQSRPAQRGDQWA